MSDAFVFFVAQFIYFLWPVFIAATLVYSLQGRARFRVILQRAKRDLLVTWSLLFAVWIFTLFAPGPNVTILPEPINTPVFLSGLILLFLSEFGGRLRNGLSTRVDLHRVHALSDLKRMDPYHFEELVTETYRSLGYRSTHVGQSGDHGVDVRLRSPSGQHIVVQCKRYRDSVGESYVRELFGTMVSERADRAILVTTAEITPPAEAWALGKPIELVDGRALLNLLEEARRRRAGSLFDRFARWLANRLSDRNAVPPGLSNRGTAARYVDSSSSRTQPIRAHAGSLQESPFRPESAPNQTATGLTVSVQPEARVSPGRETLTQPSARTQPGSNWVSVQNLPGSDRVEITQVGHQPAPITGTPDHPLAASRRLLAPTCPACGSRMQRKAPRPGDRPMRILFKCSRYPECRAVVEG